MGMAAEQRIQSNSDTFTIIISSKHNEVLRNRAAITSKNRMHKTHDFYVENPNREKPRDLCPSHNSTRL
ncbi:unnamed protein product [Linum trigynum]|uniref:Uncharacterized protein n=1 Tax=Linum trigynum TaxID=586398 RepID=A0AAV2EBZ5_9ROSI